MLPQKTLGDLERQPADDSPSRTGCAIWTLHRCEPGKGKNVWSCIGYLLACQDSSVVAIHDCDITTYSKRHAGTAGLSGGQPRPFPVSDGERILSRAPTGSKLNGRVSRLLVSPILIALKRTIGDRDYIDFLRSFRYPLSGEFAMRVSTLADLRIPSDWGLEIGVLSEGWRNLAPKSVCQVEIADSYDHKHQPLSEEDANAGLSRMSVDICKALYRKLATDGTVFSEEVFREGELGDSVRGVLFDRLAELEERLGRGQKETNGIGCKILSNLSVTQIDVILTNHLT